MRKYGGAINNHGILMLVGDTITSNVALFGGGLFNDGSLTVIDSTVAGNSSVAGEGGGILNAGTLSILDSTIARNDGANNYTANNSLGYGGGVANLDGMFSLRNSIVAANNAGTGGSADVYGAVTSLGHNLVGSDERRQRLRRQRPDRDSIPTLGPLQSNGGPDLDARPLPTVRPSTPATRPPRRSTTSAACRGCQRHDRHRRLRVASGTSPEC